MVHVPSLKAESTGRGRRRVQTVERIVRTAMRVLNEEGFEALTIQRLASELGYAVGAIYRYFKSKDALLVSMLHRVMEYFDESLRRSFEVVDSEYSGRSPAEITTLKILVSGQVYVRLAERRPGEFGLMSTMIGDPRELLTTEDAVPLVPATMRVMGQVVTLLRDAEKTEAFVAGEVNTRTVAFWAALQGALQLRKLGRFGVEALKFDLLPRELMTTLLCGWGAPRERVLELLAVAETITDRIVVAGEREDELLG